ncbi:PepSY domain-containing protein [uncultured Sphingomonas sp.]|uniref:PepSY domain-containing protein n=1 Tax=uncultured Sphingomonas sp. TaxID=158754 RepID=UPI00374A37F9
MIGHSRSAATRARILVRRVHLWLGLSLGLSFAVLGLTGSALAFYTGIDAALHPVVEARPGDAPPGLASPAWDRAQEPGVLHNDRLGP